MKDPLVKGHPLHAMLTDVPVGTTVAAVTFDLLDWLTGNERWRFAARASLGVALGGGAASALVGLWDYQAVPRDHPARATGARHGVLNGAALLALGASFWLRGRGRQREALGFGALSAGFTLLLASSWLGGELVFREGWRVTPAEHAEQLEADLRQSGERERIERAHRVVREYETSHALLP